VDAVGLKALTVKIAKKGGEERKEKHFGMLSELCGFSWRPLP
jgi:hypothetical protein